MRGIGCPSAVFLGLAGAILAGERLPAQEGGPRLAPSTGEILFDADTSHQDDGNKNDLSRDGGDSGWRGPRLIEPLEQFPDLDRAYPLLKIGEILGMNIRDKQGELLGKVDDLIVDPRSGRIRYVATTRRGVSGAEDRLSAIPWDVLRLCREKNGDRDYAFVLPLAKHSLEKAPTFDRDHWPGTADDRWGREIDQFYDQRLPWTGRDDRRLR